MIRLNFDVLAHATLTQIGEIVTKQAQDNMDEVSHGRVYVIHGKRHVASKYGDSPNNMTGAYRATIRYELHGRKMEFGAGNSTVDYVKYLEAGRLNRPNIVKSVVENRGKIEKEVQKLFERSIKWA